MFLFVCRIFGQTQGNFFIHRLLCLGQYVKSDSAREGKQQMKTDQMIGYLYMSRLGTPTPTNAMVEVGDHWEKVLRYEYDNTLGLMAVLESGTRFNDYEHMADGLRRAAIKKFYREANSGKVAMM